MGNEETRRSKGTGLGLYIVKYLVEKHGGTVLIKNNIPKGSRFEISIPA
ncbi:MAG TPA: ATP-binding protein [Bacteroidia bacterium]